MNFEIYEIYILIYKSVIYILIFEFFCNDYYGTNYRNMAIIKPQQCHRSTCTLERANDANAKNASAVSSHVATQT